MKTNAILRIVFFTLAILVLVGLLLAGLGIGSFLRVRYVEEYTEQTVTKSNSTAREEKVSANSNNNDSPVTSGDYSITIPAASIRDLEIDWASGSITLSPSDNVDEILVTEYGVNKESQRMICRQSGDTLKIEFAEKGAFSGIHVSIGNCSKDLEILVPRDWVCQDLEIDAASANVEVQDLTIHSVDFDGASGLCKFKNCTVDEIDLDTASGDVDFSGTLNILSCDAMSAKCNLVVTNVPSRIDVDSLSGDIDLTLPKDCGFTVRMEALSSDYSFDFPTMTQNGNHVYGDGSCRIDIDAMSGKVTIRNGG